LAGISAAVFLAERILRSTCTRAIRIWAELDVEIAVFADASTISLVFMLSSGSITICPACWKNGAIKKFDPIDDYLS